MRYPLNFFCLIQRLNSGCGLYECRRLERINNNSKNKTQILNSPISIVWSSVLQSTAKLLIKYIFNVKRHRRNVEESCGLVCTYPKNQTLFYRTPIYYFSNEPVDNDDRTRNSWYVVYFLAYLHMITFFTLGHTESDWPAVP